VKTDELIAMLAAGASPVESGTASRRLRRALLWGLPGAALLMLMVFGVRPDVGRAAALPMFWVKLVFPAGVAGLSFLIAQRLSRPGVGLGKLPVALIALFAIVWLMGTAALGMAGPADRGELLFGETWNSCPFNIALLSLPLFAASMWAMKGLAPTRPALAGAAAGLLSGAAAAVVYALHCPEMHLPFLGVWYVAGMLIPTAAGAALGVKLLRW
jgi:hypothetical protein